MWFTNLATKRPLGEQTEPKMRTQDIICVHTMVGYLNSTDRMFRDNGYSGTESHFGVGGIWGSDRALALDGAAYQWQDTAYQADANLDGNARVISIETADNAPMLARDIAEWTPAQVRKIVALIVALCRQYDIPPVLIPDTKPGRRGLAYHAQGIAPNRVSGGERWSLARGKECPGPVRIDQFVNDVIPKVRKALTLGDDMALSDTDKAWLSERIRTTMIAVLSEEKLIDNVDQDNVVTGQMTFVRQAVLDDFKHDRDNVRFDSLEAQFATVNGKLTEILGHLVSPTGP